MNVICLNCVSVPYEITLLSNGIRYVVPSQSVSVPYEITLLSNFHSLLQYLMLVSVPYEITLLSNSLYTTNQWDEFQYLMKLHYSQTGQALCFAPLTFQYLMKLHYSQTRNSSIWGGVVVSVPYEITLLSNSYFCKVR